MTQSIQKITKNNKVIPVVTINHLDSAIPLAKALLAGGLSVIEVTLRTSVALKAISAITTEVPECIIGAGTVIEAEQFNAAIAAGAKFAVSPASTTALLESGLKQPIPFVPGASTPSEILRAHEMGYSVVKFFPAEQSGGPSALKSYQALFPNIKFMPTGGITLDTAKDYLELANVICIGGSWITPQDIITNQDWQALTNLAKKAKAVF